MKLDLFETHDRFVEFIEPNSNQSKTISHCCQHLIDQRPFGNHSFYIFAHARTAEDGFSKILIWQPRLTRPKPQTNSMLFKAYPGTDNIKVCWMIPAREMWSQYKKGNVTQSDIVNWSIHQFKHNRQELEASEPDDLSDAQINQIYKDISLDAKYKKHMDNLYLS